MSEISDALSLARIEIKKYDEKLIKPIRTSKGNFTPEVFTDVFREALGRDIKKFPSLIEAIFDDRVMKDILIAHAKDSGIWAGEKKVEVPLEYSGYQLNMDLSAKETTFFLTKDDIKMTTITGNSYIKVCGMSEAEAVIASRHVVPEYQPRGEPGVSERKCRDGTVQSVLNTYIPPSWTKYDGKTGDALPGLFLKLVNHLIPRPLEREFFYSWLHDSMYSRAATFLVLCGAPGVGKNTLKSVMTALHGRSNTVDGKLTTLTSNFNGALVGNTLHWFDELEYSHKLEPRMKELPNQTVSIELKGVDSTPSSDIFCSFVISNNDTRNNYLAYDARKFAPLDIGSTDLLQSMTNEEIDTLKKKVDEQSPDFDAEFVAQIARWVKRRGRSKKWPHLAYKGPMFWRIASDSMFAWQKVVVRTLLTSTPGGRIKHDPDKGFLFSTIAAQVPRRTGNNSRVVVPDFAHVMPFLNIYRNLEGKKVFETEKIPGDTMSDFWVIEIAKKPKRERDDEEEEPDLL